MRKTLRRILLISGFLASAGLFGAGYYLNKIEEYPVVNTILRVTGLISPAGIIAGAITPKIRYKNKTEEEDVR